MSFKERLLLLCVSAAAVVLVLVAQPMERNPNPGTYLSDSGSYFCLAKYLSGHGLLTKVEEIDVLHCANIRTPGYPLIINFASLFFRDVYVGMQFFHVMFAIVPLMIIFFCCFGPIVAYTFMILSIIIPWLTRCFYFGVIPEGPLISLLAASTICFLTEAAKRAPLSLLGWLLWSTCCLLKPSVLVMFPLLLMIEVLQKPQAARYGVSIRNVFCGTLPITFFLLLNVHRLGTPAPVIFTGINWFGTASILSESIASDVKKLPENHYNVWNEKRAMYHRDFMKRPCCFSLFSSPELDVSSIHSYQTSAALRLGPAVCNALNFSPLSCDSYLKKTALGISLSHWKEYFGLVVWNFQNTNFSTLLMMSMWFLTTSLWILRWGVHDWYGAKIGLVSALLFAGHMAHLLLCAIMTQIQYRYEAMTLPAALIPLGYYLVCLLMKYACGPTHNKSPILINHS